MCRSFVKYFYLLNGKHPLRSILENMLVTSNFASVGTKWLSAFVWIRYEVLENVTVGSLLSVQRSYVICMFPCSFGDCGF